MVMVGMERELTLCYLGMIAGGVEAEEKVREKYAEQGIDLSKGQSESGE
jgi:hypothetical protein